MFEKVLYMNHGLDVHTFYTLFPDCEIFLKTYIQNETLKTCWYRDVVYVFAGFYPAC